MELTGIKIVIVGDSGVGKTLILHTFKHGKLPEYEIWPTTVIDKYSMDVRVDNETYSLDVFDTSGVEDYDRHRPLNYPQTDVLFVIFSVVRLASFENVSKKWIPEVRHHCPKTPIILLGTQLIFEATLTH